MCTLHTSAPGGHVGTPQEGAYPRMGLVRYTVKMEAARSARSSRPAIIAPASQ